MDTQVLRPFPTFPVMWNEAPITAEQIPVSTIDEPRDLNNDDQSDGLQQEVQRHEH